MTIHVLVWLAGQLYLLFCDSHCTIASRVEVEKNNRDSSFGMLAAQLVRSLQESLLSDG